MDKLKRIILFILFWGIIWYILYLLFTNTTIVNWTNIVNYIIYWLLLIIFLYYIIFYSIKPTYIKWYKIINTLIWLFIVYLSQSFLLNSWYDRIYYWDIFSVIWVILTILGFTNVFLSKESKKAQEESKSEIIEVD